MLSTNIKNTTAVKASKTPSMPRIIGRPLLLLGLRDELDFLEALLPLSVVGRLVVVAVDSRSVVQVFHGANYVGLFNGSF
jgi:hypothetical protein